MFPGLAGLSSLYPGNTRKEGEKPVSLFNSVYKIFQVSE